jgi:hypothetical protein
MSDPNQRANPSTFRLRRRTPGSFVLVPCPKQGRSIRCQGQLEAATAVILGACPRVVRIEEQPLDIWYSWQGKGGTFEIQILDGHPASPRRRQKNAGISYIVPDFLVEMTSGPKRLVEVKPSNRLAHPTIQRKLTVGQRFANSRDWTFHVVTEKQLFQGPLLTNLRLLNRYRQARLDEGTLEQLILQVPTQGIEFSALLAMPDGDASAKVHLSYLLATGQLSFDPRAGPLDDRTLIFPGGVISWDPFDSVWAPSGCSRGGSGGSSANSPPTASSPKTSNST